MKIVNYDKNGNIIKDLSKVTLPEELSIEIYELLARQFKDNPDNQSKSDKKTEWGGWKNP